MQKRYCTCGTGIWVRYLFANAHWLAFFYGGDSGEIGTSVCPQCGRGLDIQRLL